MAQSRGQSKSELDDLKRDRKQIEELAAWLIAYRHWLIHKIEQLEKVNQ